MGVGSSKVRVGQAVWTWAVDRSGSTDVVASLCRCREVELSPSVASGDSGMVSAGLPSTSDLVSRGSTTAPSSSGTSVAETPGSLESEMDLRRLFAVRGARSVLCVEDAADDTALCRLNNLERAWLSRDLMLLMPARSR